jgi:hypothetical protein
VRGAVRDIISVFVTPTRIFVTQLAIVMMQHFELFVHWSLYLNVAAHFFAAAADQHCVEISAQFLSLKMLCFQ